jgi:hypothetical protein
MISGIAGTVTELIMPVLVQKSVYIANKREVTLFLFLKMSRNDPIKWFVKPCQKNKKVSSSRKN